ncbi:MAG: hypothetical protein RIR12_2045 [Bacteroidota bacterium]|jgi:hypothetical protein
MGSNAAMCVSFTYQQIVIFFLAFRGSIKKRYSLEEQVYHILFGEIW